MKTKKSMWVSATGLFLLVFQLTLSAAPLNLPTPFPDPNITTNGTGVTYNASTGTLTITGSSVTSSIAFPDGSSAKVSGSPAPGAVTGHSYVLTANFDPGTGAFLTSGSSVTVGGYVVDPGGFGAGSSANSAYGANWSNSGTVIKMNLVDFGFTGTPNLTGTDTITFEWLGDIIGGDLFDTGLFFGPTGGVVAVGDVFWGSSGSFGGSWDPSNTNDMSAFLTDFHSTSDLLVNSFVPVPAAIWLFGSGLLGLIGAGARRRRLK